MRERGWQRNAAPLTLALKRRRCRSRRRWAGSAAASARMSASWVLADRFGAIRVSQKGHERSKKTRNPD
jgi:hypothetical protein